MYTPFNCRSICFGFFALQHTGVGSFEKNQFSNVRNCTSAPRRLCHEDKHLLSLMKLKSSLVVFRTYGPQSVVHFGWALTVDCCPVLFPIPMSSIKFTLLSTSAKGNFCSMLLPKFWIKHSRRYFGSKIVAHAATEKSFDKRLATAIWWCKSMHQQLMKKSKNSTANLERSGNHQKNTHI